MCEIGTQVSNIKSFNVGVSQGSILTSLLSLFYFTDLPNVSVVKYIPTCSSQEVQTV